MIVLALLTAALLISPHSAVPALAQPTPAAADASPDPAEQASDNGLPTAGLTARQGEALERARQSLEQILESIDRPAYLDPAPDRQPQGEPRLAAQRAYVAGRQAWLDGQNFEAVRQLESALRLAPDHPHVLRLLGRIYSVSGNRVRGAQYLERAARQDPADAETLFYLGQFAVQQGKWAQAIATLAEAAQRIAPDEAALTPLVQFYLGSALEREQYDAAAIEALQAALADAPRPRDPWLTREWGLLQRQRSAVLLTVGDAWFRLGKPKAALDVYRKAERVAESPGNPVALRLLHTYLHMNQPEKAQAFVLERVAAEPDGQSLSLVRYLLGAGGGSDGFVERVHQMQEKLGRPAALALLLAEQLGGAQGAQILREHLTHKPADGAAFERWMQMVVDKQDPATHKAAVLGALEVVESVPDAAGTYGYALLRALPSAEALITAIDQIAEARQQSPTGRLLRSIALVELERYDEARALLEAIVEDNPENEPGRMALARLMIGLQQYEKADALLAAMPEQASGEVRMLRVQVLQKLGRYEDALALVDELVDLQPQDLGRVVVKAGLLRQMEKFDEAERVLLQSLDQHPQAEALYQLLFDLYDTGRIADAQAGYQRLLRRMLQTIPDSRLGRIKRAELLLHDHNTRPQAEKLLESVLEDNARDYQALSLMVDLLEADDRAEEATRLLEARLEGEGPHAPALLQVAIRHFEQQNQVDRVMALSRKLIEQQTVGVQRTQQLAVLLLRNERADEALDLLVEALEKPVDDPMPLAELMMLAGRVANQVDRAQKKVDQLIERYPDQATDLRFHWAMTLSEVGRDEQSQALLQEVLKADPDHADANNALGYTWADQNKNLEKARLMIGRAIEEGGANAAYLDSMGWVEYKLGRFDTAVQWLQRSMIEEGGQNPVILDHLGDALYRTGQKDKAQETWRKARTLLQQYLRMQPLGLGSREMRALSPALDEKIRAVEADQPAPVADSPMAQEQEQGGDAAAAGQ